MIFLVQVTGLISGLVPASFLHSFRTLSNCLMLDVDVGLYKARTTAFPVLRPRYLSYSFKISGIVPTSFLHSFRTLSNC